MPVLLAFLSGVSFGAGDFFGGLATREEGSSPTVVLWSQVVSVAALAGAVWWFPTDASAADLVWGGLSGLAGAAGLMLLYRGLAVGSMSLVAPVAAVGAAVVPVAYGSSVGDRPGLTASIGAAIGLVGVWLLSGDDGGDAGPRWRSPGLAEAVSSGAAFGLFFILIANTSDDSGLLPLVAARVASISVLLVVVRSLRGTIRIEPAAVKPRAGAGFLDITANALFLLAARAGSLPVAAVLSSLYPASTVLLAWSVLGERINQKRTAGLIAVGAGIALIAVGGT